MTGKVFENTNAKRQFVTLYEDLDDDKKQRFGQEIRNLFDEKITDVTRIEGFYLNEADVRKCYDVATKEPQKTTTFRDTAEEENTDEPIENEQLPKGW